MSKFRKVCDATWAIWGGSSAAFALGCPVVGMVAFALAVAVTAVVARS